MPRKELEREQLNQLFHQYSELEIVQSHRNNAAFANDVYELSDSNDDRYVLRVLRLQLPETVTMEAALQDRLKASNINTPHYIKFANGSYVGEVDEMRFTLSQYIEGEVPQIATLELIHSLGTITSQMHQAWQGATIPRSKMQWLHPENAQNALDEYDGKYKSALTRLINVKDTLFSLSLPETVIHGDLWLGNVFAEGNKVTAVFDLETAQFGIRLLDLGRTYVSMRLETDYLPEIILRQLFDGYDITAKNPLTKVEKDNFGLVVAFVSGVCAVWHAAQGTNYAEPYLKFGEEAL